MKDFDIKDTDDDLVRFIATDKVPNTTVEPYYCGFQGCSGLGEWKAVYEPYIESENTNNELIQN